MQLVDGRGIRGKRASRKKSSHLYALLDIQVGLCTRASEMPSVITTGWLRSKIAMFIINQAADDDSPLNGSSKLLVDELEARGKISVKTELASVVWEEGTALV
jgi:hypothetical protein